MLRVGLVVLGIPAAFLLLVQIALWTKSAGSPQEVTSDVTVAPISGYTSVGRTAIDGFRRLPPHEQRTLRQEITRRLKQPLAWLQEFDSSFDVLCLGEAHRNSSRRFIGAELLPNLRFDLLALEITARDLARMREAAASGKPALLLGADIRPILDGARIANPDARLVGIEESANQRKARIGTGGRRESSLLSNFLAAYRPGERAVVLIGALHCANDNDWFRARLVREMPGPVAARVVGVRVVGSGRDAPIQSLIEFADVIDVPKREFVLASGDVVESLATWFPLLRQQVFDRYDYLVVFDDL